MQMLNAGSAGSVAGHSMNLVKFSRNAAFTWYSVAGCSFSAAGASTARATHSNAAIRAGAAERLATFTGTNSLLHLVTTFAEKWGQAPTATIFADCRMRRKWCL